MKKWIIATGLIAIMSAPALAQDTAAPSERVKYVDDPIYVPLGGADNHPMLELFNLAEDDDPRAQFILADLYSKGKGGIGKNVALAKILFEHSAKLGNHDSLVRLAALAKHDGNKIEAYKWYDLAVSRLKEGRAIKWARDQRDALELNRADRNKATDAAKTWERAALEPLRLHTPLNPLKKETTADTTSEETETTEEKSEVETEAEVETETKTEDVTETEKDEDDEQN